LHEVRRNALKSEGCESRANIGNIARVSQMSRECRKLRGASDELGSDMGDCLQLILTQYEPNGNCVPQRTTVSTGLQSHVLCSLPMQDSAAASPRHQFLGGRSLTPRASSCPALTSLPAPRSRIPPNFQALKPTLSSLSGILGRTTRWPHLQV